MEMNTKNFENCWKEFMRGNYSNSPPERLDRYELARMFYEFGFSRGLFKN